MVRRLRLRIEVETVETECAKRSFKTKEDGLVAASAITRTAKKSKVARVYKCNNCGFWHITSRKK